MFFFCCKLSVIRIPAAAAQAINRPNGIRPLFYILWLTGFQERGWHSRRRRRKCVVVIVAVVIVDVVIVVKA